MFCREERLGAVGELWAFAERPGVVGELTHPLCPPTSGGTVGGHRGWEWRCVSGKVTGVNEELEFLRMTRGYILEFKGGNSKEFLHK